MLICSVKVFVNKKTTILTLPLTVFDKPKNKQVFWAIVDFAELAVVGLRFVVHILFSEGTQIVLRFRKYSFYFICYIFED